MSAAVSIPALVAWTVVFAVAAYAICGIPFGLLIAAAQGHVDVRKVGSGNIGTTNVARSVGKSAAALTLLCDLGKGLLSMYLARHLLGFILFSGWDDVAMLEHTTVWGTSMSVVFLGCILGHVFSPYLNFKGGKGIAVGFGAALGLYWPVALGLLAVFVVLAVPSRYVSLGSVCAAVSLPLWCALFGFPPQSLLPVVAAALVVVWAHRENVKKLASGTERKFAFHKEGADDDAVADKADPDVEPVDEPANEPEGKDELDPAAEEAEEEPCCAAEAEPASLEPSEAKLFPEHLPEHLKDVDEDPVEGEKPDSAGGVDADGESAEADPDDNGDEEGSEE